jgi:TonB family protein
VTSDEIDEYQHATPATISFVVDTTGRALEVLVDRSSGSRLIDDRTVQWITTSRYRPATVDGFPKKMSVRLSVMAPIPASRHGP